MRCKKIIICLILLLLLTPIITSAETRLAVMDFKAKGVSHTVADNVSELIRTELINIGKYTVLERSQMSEILKEQSFQMTGCTDVSCAVQVGKLLSARKIMVGSVMQVGSKIVISAE
jgi:curli biogenesis system outer membrane secretion channel CsgG